MDLVSKQTEEALGWAAESAKAVEDAPQVNTDLSFKDAATFIASATPVIGDAMAAKEVYDELNKDDPNYFLAGALGGAAVIGLVPGLGDAAANAIRAGAKKAAETVKRVEVDPNALGSMGGNIRLKGEVGTGIPKVDMISNSSAGLNNKTVTQSAVDLMNEPAFGEGFAEKLQKVAAENSIAAGDKTFSPMQVYTELKDRVNSDDFTVVAPKPKDSFASEYDYDLTLKMEDMIDEWAMGNVSNADLRKNLATLDIKLPYRIGPKADPSSLDIQMPDGTIYKGTGDVPSKPRPLTLDATSDAVDDLGFSEKDLADWKASNYAKDKFRIPPDDEMAAAATNLREGKITSEEFRKLSDERQPIKPITEMPKFPTKEEVVKSLHATDPRKTKKGVLGVNKAIEDGTPISSRLDIPAYNNSDTWVVSLHDGSVKDGKTVGYGQSAVLNNVSFTSNPLAASKIATGSAKTTIARMQGEWQNMDPEDVYKTVESLFDDPEWVQVGMNPYRASYFYDKSDGMPVVSAEQVMQVGPLVFAKKAKKTTPDDPQFEFENKVTGVKANFNEGGMAMDEQTRMAFALGGSVEDVDPVSGNEVPPGSLPEEVRDDIEANLSEGEYVVPADVVRFYGVKFFEDLRTQAKEGFADMEANGRIGGQPMPPEGMEMVEPDGEDFPFDISELQTVAEDQPMVNMKDGGYLKGYNEGGFEAPAAQGIPDVSSIFETNFMADNIEYKVYTDPRTGAKTTLRFVNGVPDAAAQALIDIGYTASEGSDSSPEVEIDQPDTGESSSVNPNSEVSVFKNEEEKVKAAQNTFKDYSDDDLFSLAEKLGDPKVNKAIRGISSFAGPVGLIASIGKRVAGFSVARELEKRYRLAETDEDRAKIQKLFDGVTTRGKEREKGIVGGGGLLGGGGILQDVDDNGVIDFGDTWLGDMLGFDVGGSGIQGPSQSDSWNGARRSGGTGSKANLDLGKHVGAVTKDDITKPATKTSSDSGGGPSAAQIAAQNAASDVGQSGMTDAEKESGAGSYSSDTEDDNKDLSGSQMKAGSGVGSGAGGSNYAGPMNKGGLMKKKKK